MSKILAIVMCGVVACAAAEPTLADGLFHELKFGVLDHDTPNLWSGFRAEPDSIALNFEALFSPYLAFFGGTVRPALGASINTEGETSNVYLDARYQYEFQNGFFVGLGVGGTVHDGQLELKDWDQKALGSRVLFHIPLEIGYRIDTHNSISAYFEHMSNAYTVDPNEGLDRLGVRYGYRF